MHKTPNPHVSEDLLKLRGYFQAKGFDIRFVGGYVRDLISGADPHDVDFCTDATPDEQLAVYQEFGVHYIATGAQHGTYTAVMNGEAYEITSLRTESEHDGRYAVMAFTKDWVEDLSRRDLTINAMALTFDGELIDPFNGAYDLENNVVRFVGDPTERMTEDYLRILRYFRFLGRYGSPLTLSTETREAIANSVHGLAQISAERIWVELQKIFTHENASWVVPVMISSGVFDYVKVPKPTATSVSQFQEAKSKHVSNDPVSLMMHLTGHPTESVVKQMGSDLKWSTLERNLALEVARYRTKPTFDDLTYALVMDKRDKELTVEVAKFWNDSNLASRVDAYAVPVFPVTGDDMMAAGVKPGAEMGKMMRDMKLSWFTGGCVATKEEVMQAFK